MTAYHPQAVSSEAFDAQALDRPSPRLLGYYFVTALCTLPAVVVVFPPLWLRYLTLRYRFEEDGVSMRVGFLFTKEVLLTYRRIQDIHLTRNLFQRWFGIATVSVQTASGSSGPEMTIEGIVQADELRDFLYSRMRGAREEELERAGIDGKVSAATVTSLLTEIRDNLRRLNAAEQAHQ